MVYPGGKSYRVFYSHFVLLEWTHLNSDRNYADTSSPRLQKNDLVPLIWSQFNIENHTGKNWVRFRMVGSWSFSQQAQALVFENGDLLCFFGLLMLMALSFRTVKMNSKHRLLFTTFSSSKIAYLFNLLWNTVLRLLPPRSHSHHDGVVMFTSPERCPDFTPQQTCIITFPQDPHVK